MTEPVVQVEFSMPETFQANRSRTDSMDTITCYSALANTDCGGVIGALGNASLFSVTPIMIGRAFNLIITPNPDLAQLRNIALIIAGTQIIRGVLQFFRNFGFELVAQRVEREILEESFMSIY